MFILFTEIQLKTTFMFQKIICIAATFLLLTACQKAKARGILAGTYRETDRMEYFAEGVQDWFNVNAEMPHTDGKHNWCNTREELQVFDPDLYNLIAEFFPKTQLQISKHAKVNQYTKP